MAVTILFRAAPLCAALFLMSACADTTFDEPTPVDSISAQAKGAAVARLNIPSEVSFLTGRCLAALETKSKAAPNLSKQGYTSRKGRQEKFGPVLNYKNQAFDSARYVELRYVEGRGRKGNRCYVTVGLGADAEGSPQAWAGYQRSIIAASKKTARSAGYVLLTTKKAGRSPEEQLKKGGITIRRTGKTIVMNGFRVLEFRFTDLTGTRFVQ